MRRLALIDGVNKHSMRNLGKEIVGLNHGAVDPAFTNGRCSFWQGSFDSNSDLKMPPWRRLSKAIKDSNSTQPIKVAYAMENMHIQNLNGEVQMRGSDHQLQQPLCVAVWSKVNGKDVRYDQQDTKMGWKTERKMPAYETALPTTCRMVRPPNQ